MAGKSVDGVAKLNADEDVRLERRPATLDEFRRLLVAASCGLPFRGLTGTDRVMLYLVASETGLRANELASLTVASLDLDARIPAITVEAASSKRRRRDVQPIRSELAARLRTWLSQRERTAASLRLRDNTADESAPSENDRESSSSPNEKTPVWQGFEDDCGLVMLPENQEPPVRLELTTYALRKCGTGSATALSDNELRTDDNASCTFSCTHEPENVAVDPELARIVSVWSKLPAYIRLAVMTLVTNAVPSESL